MIEKTVVTAAEFTQANAVGPDASGKQTDILISAPCIVRIYRGANAQFDVVGDITLDQSVGLTGAVGCAVKDATPGTHVSVTLRLWQQSDPTPTYYPAGALSVTTTVLPAGCIVAYGGSAAPTGYVLCDGSTYDGTTATYAALWTAIGAAYGGVQAAFQVPDLRGRTLAGLGTHADVNALGDNDGVALANRSPRHNSTVTDPGHVHDYNLTGGGGNQPRTAAAGVFTRTTPTGSGFEYAATTGVTVGPGGTLPVDMPAYGVANYMISLGA